MRASSPLSGVVTTGPRRVHAVAARGGTFGGPVTSFAVRWAIRGFLATYLPVLALVRLVRGRPRPIGPEGADILLTGTFHSDNWVASHIRPLAQSVHCRRIRVVAVAAGPAIDKVYVIAPSPWLGRLAGPVGARLLTFLWIGLRERADIVGGFHLLLNGLAAILLARLTRARALYFCVGGPAEVLDGGLMSENRLFERLERPDPVVERRLLRVVARCDLVITMGTRAVQFFRQRGVDTAFHVVAGGIDGRRFSTTGDSSCTDLVFVGRLAPVKRVDLLLDAIARIRAFVPGVSATVVGDGPLRQWLQERADELGLHRNVVFAGQQRNVEEWLRRARVFVLTSETEGLALSMIEAMLCGLPVVVSRVGDLPDLVEDGANGYLVGEQTAEAFATPLLALLGNDERRRAFGRAARRAAARYELGATTQSWDAILGPLVSQAVAERPRCAG